MFETILGLLVFAIGASVGSFLNVVADRLPAGQSLVSPRSHCPNCKRQIPTRELLPIVSYLWLRGKCRVCGEKIPLRVFGIEAITGLLFVVVYLKFDYSVTFAVVSAGVAFLMAIAIIDLEHRLILNRMVLPAMAVMLVLSPFWTELGIDREFVVDNTYLASLLNSLAAGIGAFVIFFVVAIIYPAGMGGGDVKMAGMLGLMVGYPGIILTLWGAVVVGGAVAITLLVLGRRSRKDAIPFGPFLSLGGIIALVGGTEIVDAYYNFMDGLVSG
jgi:leader peptidase (prepilin peptidase)/N-methyltransferase